MKRTIYYIDSENINCKTWYPDYDSIIENDIFCVLYTQNSSPMSIHIIDEISRRGIQLKLIKCHTGQNALDFQLSSIIGYNIAKLGERFNYCIMSNDKGYDPLIQYWNEHNISIRRVTPRHEPTMKPENTEPKETAPAASAPSGPDKKPDEKPAPAIHTGIPVPKQELYRTELLRDGFSGQHAHEVAAAAVRAQNRPEDKRLDTVRNILYRRFGKADGRIIYNNAEYYIQKWLT